MLRSRTRQGSELRLQPAERWHRRGRPNLCTPVRLAASDRLKAELRTGRSFAKRENGAICPEIPPPFDPFDRLRAFGKLRAFGVQPLVRLAEKGQPQRTQRAQRRSARELSLSLCSLRSLWLDG